jgi:AcrR family transcriptional regulator
VIDATADEAPETLERDIEGIERVLARELGPELADAHAEFRRVQARWTRERYGKEGLRERKKRLTRQQISDVATTLFIVRGFEHVTVAQIAEVVGVSEKTVYNYFPTKESLVFDEADEASARIAAALRERDQGESPARAIVRALSEDAAKLEDIPDETHVLLPLFAEMVACTPPLRAAWLELQDRLVEVATVELARHADLSPQEPEPAIAARAIVGLVELYYKSHIRHIEEGLRAGALTAAVRSDLERAARLLDAGLWSFNLLTLGRRSRPQLQEALRATEETRQQVMDALAHARTAWRDIRDSAQAHASEQHQREKHTAKAKASTTREEIKRLAKAQAATTRDEIKRAAKAQAAAKRDEIKQAAKAQATATRDEIKRAAKGDPRASKAPTKPGPSNAPGGRAAYEAFHQSLAERHEAIRQRAEHLRNRTP